MISEKNKQRIEEAKNCESCANWHKYCNAECCRTVFINLPAEDIGDGKGFLNLKVKSLNNDEIRYYRAHGIQYLRGILRCDKSKLIAYKGKIMYVQDCRHLKDCLCTIHNDKPKVCKDMTLERAYIPGANYEITENCLFRYKCKEGLKNVEEESNRD